MKTLSAELRPYILDDVIEVGKIESFNCEADFANPSSGVITIILIYYLFKVYLFDKPRHVVLTKDEGEEYEDENYFVNFFTLERSGFILSEYT